MSEQAVNSLVRPGFASRVLDHFVFLFGSWTLAVHLAMFLRLDLYWAMGLYVVIHGALLVVVARLPGEEPDSLDRGAWMGGEGLRRAGILVGTLLLAFIWLAGIDTLPIVNWLGAAALVGLGFYATLRAPLPGAAADGEAGASPDRGRAEGVIWGMALAGAVLLLFLARPNADDSLYTSLANRAMTHPEEPVLWMDSLHGFGFGALMTDIYRVHAYEVLSGVLGLLTGIRPIVFLQMVIPPLGAALIMLSAGRLARMVAARDLVAILVIFFLLSAFFHNSYGFFRIQQGKHLLFMILPMLGPVLMNRYVATGALRHWIALMAMAVAGCGLSSSGLYFVPLVLGASWMSALFLQAGTMEGRVLARRLALGTLPLIYPFAVTVLVFLTEVDFGKGEGTHFDFRWIWRPDLLSELTEEWERTPSRLPQIFALTTLPVFLAWAFARSRAMLALGAAMGLSFLLVIYNPLAVGIYEDTPWLGTIYKRIQFLYPMVFFLAVILASGLAALGARRWWTGLAGLAMLAVILVQGPLLYRGAGIDWLNPRPPVAFKAPLDIAMKIQYERALCVLEYTGRERRILAPDGVGGNIPLVPGAPPMLLNRDNNAKWIARVVGKEEAEARRAMTLWVGNEKEHAEFPPFDPELFRERLSTFDVGAVAVDSLSPRADALTRVLDEEGYGDKGRCSERWDIWVK